MQELPEVIQKKLRNMALEQALGNILTDVPDDLVDGSPFMLWYELVLDAPRPEDLGAWEPFEDYDDDQLRDLISNEAGARFCQLKEVFLLGVQELLPTLEWVSRCAHARLAGCDAYMIKQDVMDKAREMVEQYKDEERDDPN